MNTADDHFAAAPWASAMSTMPATIATGKVAAWIQPRHVGLSSSAALASASSTSGSAAVSRVLGIDGGSVGLVDRG